MVLLSPLIQLDSHLQVKFSGFLSLNRKAELDQAFKPCFWICLITPPGKGMHWCTLICTGHPSVTASTHQSTALASHRGAAACTGALHGCWDPHCRACCRQQIELTCSWTHPKGWHTPWSYWLLHCTVSTSQQGERCPHFSPDLLSKAMPVFRTISNKVHIFIVQLLAHSWVRFNNQDTIIALISLFKMSSSFLCSG